MSNNQYKLTEEILKLSVARTWAKAKSEWTLVDVNRADEPESCLCGHYPIIEICTIRNKHNGNQTDVGNYCVKKFLDLPSEIIFSAVRRVSNDFAKSLNRETIELAYSNGWLTEWEHTFYIDTIRKRKLTPRQHNKRYLINEKILKQISRSRTAVK
jgi:hypothetical protein